MQARDNLENKSDWVNNSKVVTFTTIRDNTPPEIRGEAVRPFIQSGNDLTFDAWITDTYPIAEATVVIDNGSTHPLLDVGNNWTATRLGDLGISRLVWRARTPVLQSSPSKADPPLFDDAHESRIISMQQFLYVIKPTRPAMLSDGPTENEAEIIGQHFAYLQNLTEAGTVFLAGRTLNTDPSSFGIVIFQAESEAEAQRIVDADPAVQQQVMGATLYPYRIALANIPKVL